MNHEADGKVRVQRPSWDSLRAKLTVKPHLLELARCALQAAYTSLHIPASTPLSPWPYHLEGSSRCSLLSAEIYLSSTAWVRAHFLHYTFLIFLSQDGEKKDKGRTVGVT